MEHQHIHLGDITISQWLDEDGDTYTTLQVDGITSDATQLGMLEIAKDILLRCEVDWTDDDE